MSDDEGSETVSEVPLPVEDDSEELGAQVRTESIYTVHSLDCMQFYLCINLTYMVIIW